MTRYKLIRWLRRIIVKHLPEYQTDEMYRQQGGYASFYVQTKDGSWFRITVEKVE